MMSDILDNLLTSIKGRNELEVNEVKEKTADILVDLFNKNGVYFAVSAVTILKKELEDRLTSYIKDIGQLGGSNEHTNN